ncbi:MAG: hypothetical protein ABUL73_01000 [Alphaproteobacteria bacterium]
MLRKVLTLLYGFILCAGLAFAMLGVTLGLRDWLSGEWLLWVTQKVGDGLGLVVVTLIFGWAFLKQKSRATALFGYIASYLCVGLAFLELPLLFGFKGPDSNVFTVLMFPIAPAAALAVISFALTTRFNEPNA